MGIERENGKIDFVGMVYRIHSTFKMDLHMDIVTYYDVESNAFREERLAQCNDYATVDATDEVKQLWDSTEEVRNLKLTISQKDDERYFLKKGAKVKVVKGRNIKKETVGIISCVYKNDTYTTIYLDDEEGNNLGKTYEQNLMIEVDGEFVDWKHDFDKTKNCRITCGGHY